MDSPAYQRNDALKPGMFVPESRFGVWFLKTETWAIHVLKRAFGDLERLIDDR